MKSLSKKQLRTFRRIRGVVIVIAVLIVLTTVVSALCTKEVSFKKSDLTVVLMPYTVESGDTLWSITKQQMQKDENKVYYKDLRNLLYYIEKENPEVKRDSLQIGDIIFIPEAFTWEEVEGWGK